MKTFKVIECRCTCSCKFCVAQEFLGVAKMQVTPFSNNNSKVKKWVKTMLDTKATWATEMRTLLVLPNFTTTILMSSKIRFKIGLTQMFLFKKSRKIKVNKLHYFFLKKNLWNVEKIILKTSSVKCQHIFDPPIYLWWLLKSFVAWYFGSIGPPDTNRLVRPIQLGTGAGQKVERRLCL